MPRTELSPLYFQLTQMIVFYLFIFFYFSVQVGLMAPISLVSALIKGFM